MDNTEINKRYTTKNVSFLFNTKMGNDLLFLKDNRTKENVKKCYDYWNKKGKGKIFLIMLEKYCALSYSV